MSSYLGEASAILSAGFWAAASFIFQSNMQVFTPMMLNFVKGIISAVIILITLLVLQVDLLPSLLFTPYLLLALSGIAGVAIGDTLYLRALHELGPHKTLILETLTAPFTGIIAYLFYGTSLSLFAWMGVVVTMIGLSIVVKEQTDNEMVPKTSTTILQMMLPLQNLDVESQKEVPQPKRKSIYETRSSTYQTIEEKITYFLGTGLVSGIIAMFLQSLGMVLTHKALQVGSFDALVATFYRLAPSIIILFLIIKFWVREPFSWPKQSLQKNGLLLFGILLGNIISLWLQQLSLEYTRPEIAQTLLATSPLFALGMGMLKGEHISIKSVVGSIVALSGVFIIVWF